MARQVGLTAVDQLFGSKTRVKLLKLFYSNPKRPFYVREITRKIDEQINSVRRELANLLNIGIISSDSGQNRLYYRANPAFVHFQPLLLMFGNASGTNDLGASGSEVGSVGSVELAVYSGFFTGDDRADIDLLVVGDINRAKLNRFIKELETQEGREIRYTVLSAADFDYRRKVNDRFLSTLLSLKHQVIIDRRGRLEPDLLEKQKAEPSKEKTN